MDKQQLREAVQDLIRETSGVLVDAMRAGAEQTRIEMAQVRQEMRQDALADRRGVIEGRLAGARSAALKAALRHELGTVEAEEQKLLSAMGLSAPVEAVKAEQAPEPLTYIREGRKFAKANGNHG